MKGAAAEWLRAAELDLLTMEKLIDDSRLTAVVAFHAQQVIEKCFKAVLEEYGDDPCKIHSLLSLWKRVELLLPEFGAVDATTLRMLDQLYIDARYPGELGLLPQGAPSLEDASGFLSFARTLHSSIALRLAGGSPERR